MLVKGCPYLMVVLTRQLLWLCVVLRLSSSTAIAEVDLTPTEGSERLISCPMPGLTADPTEPRELFGPPYESGSIVRDAIDPTPMPSMPPASSYRQSVLRDKADETVSLSATPTGSPLLEHTESDVSLPWRLDPLALVYAIEQVRCEGSAGVWVTVYEGILLPPLGEIAVVQLWDRIGLRYHPESDGINSEDWWCIPTRRYCYSRIAFGAWGSPFHAFDITSFPSSDVFAVSATLVEGLAPILESACTDMR